MQRPVYERFCTVTTRGSADIFHCSPDESLHPIRFVLSMTSSRHFLPTAFTQCISALMDWDERRKKKTLPTTLTPCGQLALTRPPQPRMGWKALRRKCNAGQMALTLGVRDDPCLVFIYSEAPAGMNNYCTGSSSELTAASTGPSRMSETYTSKKI